MLKSVGMTPKGFNKMINYESIFYGVKALLYGLPISITVMVLTSICPSVIRLNMDLAVPWLSIYFLCHRSYFPHRVYCHALFNKEDKK